MPLTELCAGTAAVLGDLRDLHGLSALVLQVLASSITSAWSTAYPFNQPISCSITSSGQQQLKQIQNTAAYKNM